MPPPPLYGYNGSYKVHDSYILLHLYYSNQTTYSQLIFQIFRLQTLNYHSYNTFRPEKHDYIRNSQDSHTTLAVVILFTILEGIAYTCMQAFHISFVVIHIVLIVFIIDI